MLEFMGFRRLMFSQGKGILCKGLDLNIRGHIPEQKLRPALILQNILKLTLVVNTKIPFKKICSDNIPPFLVGKKTEFDSPKDSG